MWRRFMMNRYAGRTGMPYRRRSYVASFGATVIVVSLAVVIGLYLLGYLAL